MTEPSAPPPPGAAPPQPWHDAYATGAGWSAAPPDAAWGAPAGSDVAWGGWHTGAPAPGYYGGPPPRDAHAGRGRRRLALGLGIASIAGLVLTVALIAFGLSFFFLGGIALVAVAMKVWWASLALAVVAIAVGLLSPGGFGRRFTSTIPAWFTVLVVATFSGGRSGGDVPVYDHVTAPPKTVRELPADAPPERVAQEANFVLASHRARDVCPLLAAAARGPECPEARAFLGASELVDGAFRTRWVRGDRALVVVEEFGTTKERLRLVREPGGWQLLDLPGHTEPCVRRATDPFRCPVRRFDAPPPTS